MLGKLVAPSSIWNQYGTQMLKCFRARLGTKMVAFRLGSNFHLELSGGSEFGWGNNWCDCLAGLIICFFPLLFPSLQSAPFSGVIEWVRVPRYVWMFSMWLIGCPPRDIRSRSPSDPVVFVTAIDKRELSSGKLLLVVGFQMRVRSTLFSLSLAPIRSCKSYLPIQFPTPCSVSYVHFVAHHRSSKMK